MIKFETGKFEYDEERAVSGMEVKRFEAKNTSIFELYHVILFFMERIAEHKECTMKEVYKELKLVLKGIEASEESDFEGAFEDFMKKGKGEI